MTSAHTIDINVVSLLENVGFLRYVLEDDENQRHYWLQFLVEHPQWKGAMEQAQQILHQLDRPTGFLTAEELESLKKRIKRHISV